MGHGDFSTFVGKSTQFCQIQTPEPFILIWVRVVIMWFTKFHPSVLKNSARSCIGDDSESQVVQLL
jgi:hypothetical protein